MTKCLFTTFELKTIHQFVADSNHISIHMQVHQRSSFKVMPWFERSKVERSLMSDAPSKIHLFLERYNILLQVCCCRCLWKCCRRHGNKETLISQRTQRHSLFTSVALQSNETNKFQVLKMFWCFFICYFNLFLF